jgi:hypothetical protein
VPETLTVLVLLKQAKMPKFLSDFKRLIKLIKIVNNRYIRVHEMHPFAVQGTPLPPRSEFCRSGLAYSFPGR